MSNLDGNGARADAAPDELAVLERRLRQDLERGLQFSNALNSLNLDQNKETIATVQAIIDLLIQAGILDVDDLRQALEMARRRVAARPAPTVRLASKGDKYAEGQTADVDCASLIHLCQSRCCTFKFFLTKQDLDEGVARWDYGNPYWIRQQHDGYCVHSDGRTRACTIHPQRPHICRAYDCRKDTRVWSDFENRIPAPMPQPIGDAPILMMEDAIRKADAAGDGNIADK
jgi:Fe-S-cluster containining protein